jgi:hypothetical protein
MRAEVYWGGTANRFVTLWVSARRVDGGSLVSCILGTSGAEFCESSML